MACVLHVCNIPVYLLVGICSSPPTTHTLSPLPHLPHLLATVHLTAWQVLLIVVYLARLDFAFVFLICTNLFILSATQIHILTDKPKHAHSPSFTYAHIYVVGMYVFTSCCMHASCIALPVPHLPASDYVADLRFVVSFNC